MQHRHDVDWFRAVAILGVLAFHFAGELFPGGYLGVDVFLAVSGFVITRAISDDIAASTFSFSICCAN